MTVRIFYTRYHSLHHKQDKLDRTKTIGVYKREKACLDVELKSVEDSKEWADGFEYTANGRREEYVTIFAAVDASDFHATERARLDFWTAEEVDLFPEDEMRKTLNPN